MNAEVRSLQATIRTARPVDWTERVVAGLRGSNAALEELYDKVLKEGRRALRAPP